jgi:hypothetical protein
MLITLARASERICLFSFSLSSEEKKAVISPLAVIVPVTARVDPLNVRFASPLIVDELTEVITLVDPGLV